MFFDVDHAEVFRSLFFTFESSPFPLLSLRRGPPRNIRHLALSNWVEPHFSSNVPPPPPVAFSTGSVGVRLFFLRAVDARERIAGAPILRFVGPVEIRSNMHYFFSTLVGFRNSQFFVLPAGAEHDTCQRSWHRPCPHGSLMTCLPKFCLGTWARGCSTPLPRVVRSGFGCRSVLIFNPLFFAPWALDFFVYISLFPGCINGLAFYDPFPFGGT